MSSVEIQPTPHKRQRHGSGGGGLCCSTSGVDGVTTATRYDNITKDISVKAMFNDARVELTLDKGDTTIKQGESLTVNAAVKLGNKAYDAANVQWSINDEMEKNGSSLTFTPDAAGTYVIKAGIEINGTFSTAQLTVTVAQDDPTTISIAYNTNQITTGASVNLTANVQNAAVIRLGAVTALIGALQAVRQPSLQHRPGNTRSAPRTMALRPPSPSQ